MNDKHLRQLIHTGIDRHCAALTSDPYRVQRVLKMARQAHGTGGNRMKKKLSVGFVMIIAVLLLAVTALAAALLWQDAGEKIAPMERENGYYDAWNTEARIELIRVLYELGELKDNPDAESVLHSTGMPDNERNALCDSIMCTYLQGSPDSVTLLSILERLHGDMSTWSMEDKVWYNHLLRTNDMLSAEDTDYILPQAGELTQAQAIAAAQSFLMSKGAAELDEALAEATMYEEADDAFYGETQVHQKGRRVWSVVFRPKEEAAPNGSAWHVDLTADGHVITYTLPQLIPLSMTGMCPDPDAIAEKQAIEIGTEAISTQFAVPAAHMAQAKAFFGYINLADEESAHALLGKQVWGITAEPYYALLSPGGDVLYTGLQDAVR